MRVKSGRSRQAHRFIGALVLLCGSLLSACGDRQTEYTGPFGRQVAEAIPRIEQAVGLKFRNPPRIETRSKAQVREFVIGQLTEPDAQREFAGISAAYKRLGMIPDTLDLQRFLVDLLEEQVIGFYDPRTKVLYVVDDSPPEAAAITITHELVHALQDQYISLDSLQRQFGQNDRQSAAQAVFEGQAVYEQIAAMLGGGNVAINLPGGWDRVRDMIRDNQAGMPVFASAPLVIQETLIFPYLSGAEFVRNFKDRRSGESLYEDLPLSTEQILHPGAYFGRRDMPTDITLPALAGGSPIYENTIGEFETRLLLFEHLRDQNSAIRGATGWDGDRYVLFSAGAGQGIAWVSVWDSGLDASEFYSLMSDIVEKRYGATSSSEAGSGTRLYSGGGRAVQLTTVELDGRPLVLYVDVPAGTSTGVLDVGRITLREAER